MTKKNGGNRATQSGKSINVIKFDDYWVVNGVRLKREYISVDDQICLLKSIMAHKPIQKSSEVNNNIKANTIIDKNQQIQVLKSMVIKRSYGLPRVCTDVIELPKDIQDCKSIQSLIEGCMKSEIQRNYENDQIIFEKKQTGSSNQFIIDYQLLPTIKKENLKNSF